jgi:collagenase-like PrtC family protease
MKVELTMGPILFHWSVDRRLDFYNKIADEAPIDRVYIGEVICSKRAPFFEKYYSNVVERLIRGGKQVVFSTLAEIMNKRERSETKKMCARSDCSVEANDSAALFYLRQRPHLIGPFFNTYNEDTLEYLVKNGATHITLPPEIPKTSLKSLGEKAKELSVSLEAQVYGRIPLALSARCYHARAHGRKKDNCQFVCENNPDGMELKTLENKPFLAINGIQTLSYRCLNLMKEMYEMKSFGIGSFRISPHGHDMIKVSRLFKSVLDFESSPEEASAILAELGFPVPFSNGFYHRLKGHLWVQAS